MTATPWAEAHERACAAGESGYLDPASGLFVMSRFGLLQRPCCGNGCRHCPYDADGNPVAPDVADADRTSPPAP